MKLWICDKTLKIHIIYLFISDFFLKIKNARDITIQTTLSEFLHKCIEKPVHYVKVLIQQSVAYTIYKVIFRAAFCESFHLHTVQTEICLETFMGCALYSGNTHHGCSSSCLSHCSFIIVCLWPCDPPGFIYAQVLSAQSRPQTANLQCCQ